MLKKLIAYDFRCTWKLTVTLFVSSFVSAIISMICSFVYMEMLSNESETATLLDLAESFIVLGEQLFLMLSYFCVGAVVLLTVVHYYKKMISDEAYLTFTLPATAGQHLFAKLVMGGTWALISSLVVFVNTVVMAIPAAISVENMLTDEEFQGAEEIVDEVMSVLDINIVIATGVLIVIAIIVQLALIYLCLTIGGVIANKYKAVAGVAIYWFSNSIVTGAIVIVAFLVSAILTGFMALPDDWETLVFLYLASLIVAGAGAICFFVNRNLLTKKLNLP